MVDRITTDEEELWMYKRRLKYLNDEMRYYIEVVQMIEREMEQYNNMIHDLVVEMQDVAPKIYNKEGKECYVADDGVLCLMLGK